MAFLTALLALLGDLVAGWRDAAARQKQQEILDIQQLSDADVAQRLRDDWQRGK